MAIRVDNVIVVKPKALFSDDILFDVTLDCTVPIATSIRWEVEWVGSVTNHDFDQILANVCVGPIEVGLSRFVLRADPPVITKIPPEDLPLTMIALKGFYRGASENDQEFIRIGYYVVNRAPEDAGEFPDPTTVEREISIEEPIVHQLPIKWG
jgi:hypothetical protein